MTYQQTAALLSLAMNYWDNICNRTDVEETAKAWAVSLADIPYNAAIKAVQELSKEKTFKPTVHEVREKAVQYSTYSPENWSMRLAWDRYIELGIPLPKWFYAGVQALGATCPAAYLQACRNRQQISAGACG